MPDPEYTFVKGQGWIISQGPAECVIETTYGKYRIINRMPKKGERYGIFGKHEHKYFKDKQLQIEIWAKHIKEYNVHYKQYPFMDNPDDSYYKNYSLCTLIAELDIR